MERAVRRKAFSQAMLILLLALATTVAAWWQVREQGRLLADARFAAMAQQVEMRIVANMRGYEQILRGGAGLLQAVPLIDRYQWRAYVQRLQVEDNYPGIQVIGFAPRVRPQDLAEHETWVRASGYPDYAVTPTYPREDYFPTTFLEPFDDRNQRAFGYDMFSHPVRRAAMERAMQSSAPTLSGKVTLVQETGDDLQTGTLLYLPVYRTNPRGPDERNTELYGFVYGAFRMDNLIKGSVGEYLRQVDLSVYDGEATDEARLYGTASPPPSGMQVRRVVTIYGRTWVLDIQPRPVLAAAITDNDSWLVLGAGVVISLLLMWLTAALSSERMKRLALADSNRQLAAARAEAEGANRAKSKFLAAASHDIRQPVQSLVLLSAALSQHLHGHPVQHLVVHLDKSLDALRTLLNSLLDISRLDAGIIEPVIEPVELDDVVSTIAEEYRLRATERGLAFRCDIGCGAVNTDRALLERILRNLLENALRYTFAGHIGLYCRSKGDTIEIDVEDTGIGIADEDLHRIFEEFYQVGNHERDRAQGLGLGLSIVRRLVQMLGHHIDLQSEVGRGTRFTVTIPRSHAAVAEPATQEA